MTVFELLTEKYRQRMQSMTEHDWAVIKEQAAKKKLHPAQIVYMTLEITEFDIRKNGGYCGDMYSEIRDLHTKKCMASNAHKQYHGKVDAYWLTANGARRFRSQILGTPT